MLLSVFTCCYVLLYVVMNYYELMCFIIIINYVIICYIELLSYFILSIRSIVSSLKEFFQFFQIKVKNNCLKIKKKQINLFLDILSLPKST